jgi:chemotaxis protein methyltransferase CheR
LADRYQHVRFHAEANPTLPSRRRLRAPSPHGPVWTPQHRLPSTVSAEEFEFLRWVLGQAGLNVGDYRLEPLARRLSACLRALRARDVNEAQRIIEYNPLRLSAAITSLVIGATAFFRDEAVFRELRTTVLPALLKRSATLRIWSAGCSEGAELYSIAILLAEAGVAEGHELLGTDCRYDAVTRARAGAFAPLAARNLSAELIAKYFRPRTGGLQVAPAVRERMRWELRLAFHPPAGQWDVVLCRNLAIYLEPQPSDRLWRAISDALRPGGYLVVGKAERPTATLPLIKVAPCIYRRADGHKEG